MTEQCDTQGGKGISLNGCECKKIFKFNGKTVRTCMIDDSNTQSGGKAFCVVEGDLCGEALEVPTSFLPAPQTVPSLFLWMLTQASMHV